LTASLKGYFLSEDCFNFISGVREMQQQKFEESGQKAEIMLQYKY